LSSETSQKKEATGRALCFSGGVDSFYSLLTYSKPIDKLIMVIGFDVDICDREGFLSVHEHLKKVAAAKDVEAVIVRTNYREHPVAGKKFKYAYGGALAGVGHLVSGVGELLLSSGFRYDEARPDGSHWQNDPLWGSESLSVVHYGADLTRDQKLRKNCRRSDRQKTSAHVPGKSEEGFSAFSTCNQLWLLPEMYSYSSCPRAGRRCHVSRYF
jgi:hypothetical protein